MARLDPDTECCSVDEQQTCCRPREKDACCAPGHVSCGCRTPEGGDAAPAIVRAGPPR